MRLKSDEEILDQATRKRIIEEINGSENMSRKDNAYRKYLAYKDRSGELVTQQLARQFDAETVQEMAYAVSNISIARKIVRKLARVYSNGVTREVPKDEASTKTIQELESILKINDEMKRTNRTLRLQHNTILYLRPCPNEDGQWWIKPENLQPFLYDVVENYHDRTKPLAVVLSDYAMNTSFGGTSNSVAALHLAEPSALQPKSDGKDQKIADPDTVTKEYVWWSKNYHFTTNAEGAITSAPVNPTGASEKQKYENPIKMLPMVNFAIDQDGKFWAEGGNDLVDGAISANSMITNVKHVGVVQGYGQFWVKGKNVPNNVKIGPSKMIRLEWNEKEDPEPQIGFASASPNLADLMKLVELEVALLLTTNNLSTSGVSTTLQGGGDFPSGIAMMIDKAESVEDVQDQEQVFKDEEPQAWLIIAKWLDAYRDSLVEELKGKSLPTEKSKLAVQLKFHPSTSIQTEGEKLENLQKRKDLGINTMVDLIMQDNPGMTEEEAEKKLLKIAEESAKRMASVLVNGKPPMPGDQPPNSGKGDEPGEVPPENVSDEDDEDEYDQQPDNG